MKPLDSLKKPILSGIILMIVAACCAVYGNALGNGFVYDDEYQVLQNPWISDFGYLPTVFSTKVWGFQGGGSSNYYRPLMHAIYMIDYHLFGFDPRGFHAVNILFHAGVSVLVFLLAYRLLDGAGTARLVAAIAATLLFITHPIHTEAVTPVMSVTDLSLAFFGLLALYLHIRCSDQGREVCLPAAASLFLAALCKETALTLPLIFFVYDYTFRRTESTRTALLRRYLPYLAVTGIYLALRTYAVGAVIPIDRHPELSTYQCLINIFPLLAQSLGKLLLPINLNAKYEFHPITSLFEIQALGSLLVILIVGYAFYLAARTSKIVFFGLALIIAPLLPTFYIRAIPYPFAERYLYLPSVGFVLIVAALVCRTAFTPAGRTGLLVVLAVVTGLYTVGTVRRNSVWRDNYSLWADTVTKSPHDSIVRNNLGLALAKQGRTQDAVHQYVESLRLNPDDDFAHYNLAFALARQGRLEEAMAHYTEVLRINPDDREARALLEATAARLKNAQGPVSR